ncbi:hypothetical protein MMC26_005339 [Xylographa opegraphella]|nr:hypothetical protein [Xylographa opegraphella]
MKRRASSSPRESPRNNSMSTTRPAPQMPPRTSLPMTASDPTSAITSMFSTFRAELDEHHDRRERVIKASRDITALSKKMIFSLQRARDVPAPLPSSIVGDISTRLANITELFSSVIPDLQGPNVWRYQRQVSPGVQEFVEAVSFQHYLTTQRLITLEETQSLMPEGVVLMEDDYVLGLFDLVGELMRFTITGIATGGKLPGGGSRSDEVQNGGEIEALGGPQKRDVIQDLRELRMRFEGMDMRGGPLGRDVEKKMEVMRTCVEKVENAAYGMIIRGRERPKGWVPEDRPYEVVESY